MSYFTCSFTNCWIKGIEIAMFRFTIRNTTGNMNLSELTRNQLKHWFVCAAHFDASSIHIEPTRTRLSGRAIPMAYVLPENHTAGEHPTHVICMMKRNNTKRTCIVGAGYSGLATARYLKEYGVENFVLYEATRHIGGTWRFDPHIGIDEDGLPLLTSMYQNLRTNTPRQTMEFGNFPFPDGTPSYPSGPCFYRYIKRFVKVHDLERHVKFRSLVNSIKRVKDEWSVTYYSTETRTNNTESCDYVVIAHGHYQMPKMPDIEGQNLFKGKIIHSRDYKNTEPFKGHKVLLVGAGASGLDLATQLVNVTNKLVHSHHLIYNQPRFPDSYVKKPDIQMFNKSGAVFNDGSFEEVDDVIFCTGYDFDFSFVDESCGVTATHKFVLPLYRHTVNIRHPSMMFVGVSKYTITRLFDTQGAYVAALIAGKFELPPPQQMLKQWLEHVKYLQTQHKKIVDVNVVGATQDQYFANLTLEAGIPRTPPVLSDIRDFNAKFRLEDLLNYRDYEYNIIDDRHYEKRYQPMPELPCPVPED